MQFILHNLLTLGTHAQRGLQYSVCVYHAKHLLVHLQVQCNVPTAHTLCTKDFQLVDFARNTSFKSCAYHDDP